MLFCPKCGSIMIPKKKENKKLLVCPSCKYSTSEVESSKITEDIKKDDKSFGIAEDMKLNPVVELDEPCKKCGNKDAEYWSEQTRSGDEGETRFFKCTKCGLTWRVYD